MNMINKIIFLCGIIFSCSLIYGQEEELSHISSKFHTDTSFALKYYTESIDSREIVGSVNNEILYFCRNKAYQLDTIKHNARIYSIDLKTKEQSYFDLEYPQLKKTIYGGIRNFWITGLAFSKNKLAVFAQDKSIIYHKISEGNYKYQQSFYLYEVRYGYFYQEYLYVFQNNNNDGYTLFRYDTTEYKKEKIKDFTFEAPFIRQFFPNRYLSIQEDCFYILESNRPAYKVYDLTGELIDSVVFSTEYPWQAIESSFIKETMKLNYGVERIYYALRFIKQKSYPCKIFPFKEEQSLIVYHQFDKEKERERYFLAWIEQNKDSVIAKSQQFRSLIYDQDLLSDSLFPIHFMQGVNCLTIPYKNTLIQISKEPGCEIKGKSGAAYMLQKEEYFRDYPPIITARFMTIKEEKPSLVIFDSLLVKDYYNNNYYLRSKQAEKWILLFQPPIYCHGCLNYILSYFNKIEVDTSRLAFGILMDDVQSYLLKRETMKDIFTYFQKPYYSCYLKEQERKDFFNRLKIRGRVPLVMMLDFSKGTVILLDDEKIFTDDVTRFEFRKSFREEVSRFLLQ